MNCWVFSLKKAVSNAKKARAAFECGNMNKSKSDRFKDSQHTARAWRWEQVEEFEQLFLTMFGRKCMLVKECSRGDSVPRSPWIFCTPLCLRTAVNAEKIWIFRRGASTFSLFCSPVVMKIFLLIRGCKYFSLNLQRTRDTHESQKRSFEASVSIETKRAKNRIMEKKKISQSFSWHDHKWMKFVVRFLRSAFSVSSPTNQVFYDEAQTSGKGLSKEKSFASSSDI